MGKQIRKLNEPQLPQQEKMELLYRLQLALDYDDFVPCREKFALQVNWDRQTNKEGRFSEADGWFRFIKCNTIQ